ncbi:hypothetical protein BX600DRAFT_526117 [Xylariales sp. PMI_506]|nr:hypothetical protein BX600DRAFT_526117 [Xylariales sp. PMI_506]
MAPSYCALGSLDSVYFDAFRCEVVHDISGLAYTEFWTRTIIKEALFLSPILWHNLVSKSRTLPLTLRDAVRESFSDCFIRYEIMALGGLALSKPGFPITSCSTRIIREHQQAAIGYHGKALNAFNRRMAEGIYEPRSIFFATILFALFELMHDNTSAAVAVVERGFHLLSVQGPAVPDLRDPGAIDIDSSSDLERTQAIRHLWLRLPCMGCLLPLTSLKTRVEMSKSTMPLAYLPRAESTIPQIHQSWREMRTRYFQTCLRPWWPARSVGDQYLYPKSSWMREVKADCQSWGIFLERQIAMERDPELLWSLRLIQIEQLYNLTFIDNSYQEVSEVGFRDMVHLALTLYQSKCSTLQTRMTTYGAVGPLLSSIIQLCPYPDVRQMVQTAVVEQFTAEGYAFLLHDTRWASPASCGTITNS